MKKKIISTLLSSKLEAPAEKRKKRKNESERDTQEFFSFLKRFSSVIFLWVAAMFILRLSIARHFKGTHLFCF